MYYCLDLQFGTVRHFPAGTYHEQMATREGRQELSMMDVVYQAWRTWKTPAAKWGDMERRVAATIMPKPPKPTRRLDRLILTLWPGSTWTHIIMRKLRGLTDG